MNLERRERDGNWEYTHKQCCSSMDTEQLLDRLNFPDFKPSPNDWKVIHEGLAEKFLERFGQGKYLSVHHPKTPKGRDDALDASALALLAAVKGYVGEMLIL